MTTLIPNTYEYHDDYVCINIHSRKYGEKKCIIDVDDLEFCKAFNWSVAPRKTKSGILLYVQTHMFGTPVLLHSILAKAPKGLVTDHVNRNTLDNRKGNLRVVTRAKNSENRGGYGALPYKYLSIRKARKGHNMSYVVFFPEQATRSFVNKSEAYAYYLECLFNITGDLINV